MSIPSFCHWYLNGLLVLTPVAATLKLTDSPAHLASPSGWAVIATASVTATGAASAAQPLKVVTVAKYAPASAGVQEASKVGLNC